MLYNIFCTGAVLLQERLLHSKGALVMARPSLADVSCGFLAASEHLHVGCNTLLPIFGMVCATRAMYNGPQSKIRSSPLPYHALLLFLVLMLWASALTPISAFLHHSEADINSLFPLCKLEMGQQEVKQPDTVTQGYVKYTLASNTNCVSSLSPPLLANLQI